MWIQPGCQRCVLMEHFIFENVKDDELEMTLSFHQKILISITIFQKHFNTLTSKSVKNLRKSPLNLYQRNRCQFSNCIRKKLQKIWISKGLTFKVCEWSFGQQLVGTICQRRCTRQTFPTFDFFLKHFHFQHLISF